VIFCGPVRPANSVAPFIRRSGGSHSDLLTLAIVVYLFLLENEIKVVNRAQAPAESNRSSFGGDTDRLRTVIYGLVKAVLPSETMKIRDSQQPVYAPDTARSTPFTGWSRNGPANGIHSHGYIRSAFERFLAQKLAVNGVRFDRPGERTRVG
jgi:hypothetical protein